MAIRHLTYLDLTPEQRALGAAAARGRIRALLANPHLTSEQVRQLRQEQIRLAKWERGTLSSPT